MVMGGGPEGKEVQGSGCSVKEKDQGGGCPGEEVVEGKRTRR